MALLALPAPAAPSRGRIDALRRRLLAAAALTALVVATVGSLGWVGSAAHATAVQRAIVDAERLATGTLAPAVDEALLSGDDAALASLDALVAARKSEGSLVRVKVWDAEGRIVYSDDPALVGRDFPLPTAQAALLASGGSTAGPMVAPEPENASEAGLGPLVEVYSAATTSTGEPLLFESYVSADEVDALRNELLLRVAPALVALVLLLASVQLVWLRAGHRRLAGREHALAHSTAAAALERRRLARRLRDSTLQGMAGVGYALESLGSRVPQCHRPLMDRAVSAVHDDVASLRRLVDGLEDDAPVPGTLSAVLRQATAPAAAAGVPVRVGVTGGEQVGAGTAELVHRVVDELTGGALAEPPADVVVVAVRERSRLRVGVTVTGSYRPEALGLVRDVVAAAGGCVDVRGQSGPRPRVDVEIPVR